MSDFPLVDLTDAQMDEKRVVGLVDPSALSKDSTMVDWLADQKGL